MKAAKNLIFSPSDVQLVPKFVTTFVEQSEETKSDDPIFHRRVVDSIISSSIDLRRQNFGGKFFVLCSEKSKEFICSIFQNMTTVADGSFKAKYFFDLKSFGSFQDIHFFVQKDIPDLEFVIGQGLVERGYLALDAVNLVRIVPTKEISGSKMP